MLVTKDSNIAEIITAYPETARVFLEYGLHCVGCIASSFDTIEQGTKAHHLTEKDLDNLVEDLNVVLAELTAEDGEGEKESDKRNKS